MILAKTIFLVLYSISGASAILAADGSPAETQKTYTGFDNIGTIKVGRSANDGAGVTAITKTFFLSQEAAQRDEADKHCTDSVFMGQLLTIDNPEEGRVVFNILEQNGIYTGVLHTGGRRDGESFRWFSPPYKFLPTYDGFWAPGEPRPDYYYDMIVYVKSTMSYAFQSYPSGTTQTFRYICEVISWD